MFFLFESICNIVKGKIIFLIKLHLNVRYSLKQLLRFINQQTIIKSELPLFNPTSLQYSDIVMGGSTSSQKQQGGYPTTGYRVMLISNDQLSSQLNILTDYIVSPDLRKINRTQSNVDVTVYSILDNTTRHENLTITNGQLGGKFKLSKIKDCILRITKVFFGSPCQKVGLASNEYIVGLIQGQYENLKDFAQILKKVMTEKECINLAVCDQSGVSRIVTIPITMLQEWKTQNKGILGCELAQGWMHRFKSKVNRQTKPKLVTKDAQELKQVRPVEIPRQQIKQIDSSQSSGEGQNRCLRLQGLDENGSLEYNFKGILRNEYIDDASSICKCRQYNNHCEKCFLKKDNNYYFFNLKTSRIIAIPCQFMFKVS